MARSLVDVCFGPIADIVEPQALQRLAGDVERVGCRFCFTSMPMSDIEAYRQNAERCAVQAEQLETAGNVTLANLYRDLAYQWHSLAEQLERNRF